MSEPTIQVGRLKLTGRAASVVLKILVGAIAALIVLSRPRVGMWISGGIWFAFNIYWGREGQRLAPVRREESARSSARHQWLRQVGLILLFAPVPGLTGWMLPGQL